MGFIYLSQSLRKSGQFLPGMKAYTDEEKMSQSLRKSGQFLPGWQACRYEGLYWRRNPFVSQVNFFWFKRLKDILIDNGSQSLRKSGQFLHIKDGRVYGVSICESQSLRKSGQFLPGKVATYSVCELNGRNPFVSQVNFFMDFQPVF